MAANFIGPVLVTTGNFVFPKVEMELEVGRKAGVSAINEAIGKFDGQIVLVPRMDDLKADIPQLDDIAKVGTLCHVKVHKTHEDGTLAVSFHGQRRVSLTKLNEGAAFYSAETEYLAEAELTEEAEQQLISRIIDSLQHILDVHGAVPQNLISDVSGGLKATQIIDKLAQFLPYLTVGKRQEILEEADPVKRLDLLLEGTSQGK
ncbi:LON peptidase substrate-binding domain-containing protein [Streptomyces sp. IBSNAI002]|uniref:LON peptidase substrate-binding domain-containing protein n=1 Tax=Streptomyces sp. IBSNAI002 TaxID=3457500 RepID=UPI003FCFD126